MVMLVFKKEGRALRWRGGGIWLSWGRGGGLLVPMSLSLEPVHAVRRLGWEARSKPVRRKQEGKWKLNAEGGVLQKCIMEGSGRRRCKR